MSNEKNVSRRAVLKVIAVGVGTATTLPILENGVLGQHKHPGMQMGQSPGAILLVCARSAGNIAAPARIVINVERMNSSLKLGQHKDVHSVGRGYRDILFAVLGLIGHWDGVRLAVELKGP